MRAADLARELRLTLEAGPAAAAEYEAEGGNRLAYLVGYYEAELKRTAEALERMARGEQVVRT